MMMQGPVNMKFIKKFFRKIRQGLAMVLTIGRKIKTVLTLSNPIFLPTAYSPALICFGRERGW
jgi:hypothetical protein